MEKEPILLFEREFTVSVEYNFFYIQDKEVEESLEDNWNEQAIKMLLATNIHTVGIRTARNDDIVVRLAFFNAAPNEDFKDWDYVIETSMYVPSGKMIIAGPLEYVPEIPYVDLQKGGYYKTRVYYGKLSTVSEDGLEGDDHYQIILWPSDDRTSKVLKQLVAKQS